MAQPILTFLIHHYGLNTRALLKQKIEKMSQKVFYGDYKFYSRNKKVSLYKTKKSVSLYEAKKCLSVLDKISVALLSKSTIAFHSPMARKPKGQKKSCVAAPLQVYLIFHKSIWQPSD